MAVDSEDESGDGLKAGFHHRRSVVLPAERPSGPPASRAEPVLLQRGDQIAFPAGNDLLVALSLLCHVFLWISRSACLVDLVRRQFARGIARILLRPRKL